MKRPKSVKLGTLTYKIKFSDDYLDEEQSAGLIYNMLQEIHIGPGAEDARRVILTHEINHGLCWIYGIPHGTDEEEVVTAWTAALSQFVADNPKVLDYIAGR